jgi:putative thiamine transport system substrate-binding protein
VKQVLLDTVTDQAVLDRPVQAGGFATATAPLWAYLDTLHPHCWRQGKAFPAAQADQHRLFADQELAWSISFNPNEVPMLIAQGQLPASAYSTGFATGMLANIHFLAIPVVAQAPAAAQVVANFLLSPAAQARKADVKVWGDPTVLDVARLPAQQRAAFGERHPAALPADIPARAEPHASWVEALETEWLRRYGVA